MLQFKHIPKESIPEAIAKAKHYRLLNEPWQAESICRDILRIEPNHQETLVILLLSITDQFDAHVCMTSIIEAKKLCKSMQSKYEKWFYKALVEECSGKASLKRDTPRSEYIAYEYYSKAIEFYEKSEKNQPKGNLDCILRRNACIRAINKFKNKI